MKRTLILAKVENYDSEEPGRAMNLRRATGCEPLCSQTSLYSLSKKTPENSSDVLRSWYNTVAPKEQGVKIL